MSIVIEKILSFIKAAFSQKYLTITMGIIIGLLVITQFNTCRNLNLEKEKTIVIKKQYDNNIKAMGDSLTVVYDKKLDQLITQKTSYLVQSVEDLKQYNKRLYDEFKDVKNIVTGISSDVKVIVPSIKDELGRVISDPKDTTKFTLPWSFPYSDKGLSQTLIGNTQFNVKQNKPISPISTLDVNEFSIKLKYDVSEQNNQYVVHASSPSKLVKFTELDGALFLNKGIDPKKVNPWSIGPYIGYGYYNDLVGGKPGFGLNMGVAVSYNIFAGFNSANVFNKK